MWFDFSENRIRRQGKLRYGDGRTGMTAGPPPSDQVEQFKNIRPSPRQIFEFAEAVFEAEADDCHRRAVVFYSTRI